ncbi:uncharacterized protein G2W53_017990 [Senna tora]|uniref:Uncharacterized protein n=1 Tax=Senna tora TaxID=362788 RepID=A0A834TTT0_9FABA|nr:uncharacterized protein G2W53_017990 [Senna tora]
MALLGIENREWISRFASAASSHFI